MIDSTITGTAKRIFTTCLPLRASLLPWDMPSPNQGVKKGSMSGSFLSLPLLAEDSSFSERQTMGTQGSAGTGDDSPKSPFVRFARGMLQRFTPAESAPFVTSPLPSTISASESFVSGTAFADPVEAHGLAEGREAQIQRSLYLSLDRERTAEMRWYRLNRNRLWRGTDELLAPQEPPKLPVEKDWIGAMPWPDGTRADVGFFRLCFAFCRFLYKTGNQHGVKRCLLFKAALGVLPVVFSTLLSVAILRVQQACEDDASPDRTELVVLCLGMVATATAKTRLYYQFQVDVLDLRHTRRLVPGTCPHASALPSGAARGRALSPAPRAAAEAAQPSRGGDPLRHGPQARAQEGGGAAHWRRLRAAAGHDRLPRRQPRAGRRICVPAVSVDFITVIVPKQVWGFVFEVPQVVCTLLATFVSGILTRKIYGLIIPCLYVASTIGAMACVCLVFGYYRRSLEELAHLKAMWHVRRAPPPPPPRRWLRHQRPTPPGTRRYGGVAGNQVNKIYQWSSKKGGAGELTDEILEQKVETYGGVAYVYRRRAFQHFLMGVVYESSVGAAQFLVYGSALVAMALLAMSPSRLVTGEVFASGAALLTSGMSTSHTLANDLNMLVFGHAAVLQLADVFNESPILPTSMSTARLPQLARRHGHPAGSFSSSLYSLGQVRAGLLHGSQSARHSGVSIHGGPPGGAERSAGTGTAPALASFSGL